ncbi:hypothetical protein ACLOJK_023420 [Asimina triloba]
MERGEPSSKIAELEAIDEENKEQATTPHTAPPPSPFSFDELLNPPPKILRLVDPAVS